MTELKPTDARRRFLNLLVGIITDTTESGIRQLRAWELMLRACELGLRESAQQARRERSYWREIGAILGISAQAASQRYAGDDEAELVARDTAFRLWQEAELRRLGLWDVWEEVNE